MAVIVYDAEGNEQHIDPIYLQNHLDSGWSVVHPGEAVEVVDQDEDIKNEARELGIRIGRKGRDTLIAEIEDIRNTAADDQAEEETQEEE